MLVYITLVVMPILTVISIDGDACSWCGSFAPDITTCGVTDSDDWTLVRAIGAAHVFWFENQDSLLGTDGWVDDAPSQQYNIGQFAAAVPEFNQFLFVTGDCTSWLITSKDAIGGAFNGDYYYEPRTVCASSEYPDSASSPIWYNREHCCVEDPWISTIDHAPATQEGKLLYGENNFGGTHAAEVIPAAKRNGVYVYVRAVQLDVDGCTDPCSLCDVCDNCIDGQCIAKECSDGLYCNGEEFCDPNTGDCQDGVVEDCPENMYCDEDSTTCLRDCASFAIDEYLTQCSDEFASDQTDISALQTDLETLEGIENGHNNAVVDRLDGIDIDIININNDLTAKGTDIADLQTDLGELESTVTTNNNAAISRLDGIDNAIVGINDDLAYIHDRIDGFKPFNKANTDETTGIVESSFGKAPARSGYFDQYKDEIIIGLVVMNVVQMIGSCYILSMRNKKRYNVVAMQETDDEERALK